VADVAIELDERAGVAQTNGPFSREQPALVAPPRDRFLAARVQRLVA
jgi:hypothetical protein